MAEAEVISLKEALYKQAQSIQELSAELEEERKAAASGVDEALSMIFRLQEERAMEKMEASQYKRMAEAKMIHAEESLAFLKETILEKEIEIAALKFQVQSYRQNIIRVGISNADYVKEANMFESVNNTFLKVTGSNDRFRRHISMPSGWLDSSNFGFDIIDKNEPLIPSVPSIWSETGECSKQLSEQRTEFFPNKSIIEEVASNSELQEVKEDLKSIQINSKCSYCSSLPSQKHRLELDSFSFSYLEKDSTGETSHSTNIQDIYEIPNSTTNESCKSGSCKTSIGAVQNVLIESLGDDLTNRTPMKYPTIGKGVFMNSLQSSEITGCHSDVEELKQRVQKLENDQWVMKEEESKRNNEQLNLLKQMREQLNILQSQTKVPKRKKLSRQDEILLVSITEVCIA
ncbi:hypothetical protein MA16_Dca025146 [Dendrobium catenatum]|uniref:GTD-binding domain-containing protein n=1 Tax=Dendrobium catenatum TaxID=906689 RepID=A0A2I0VPJ8_9ASPA|nr:hypothetical protein MA16_Dca025146 [Dendrobium catenatum]